MSNLERKAVLAALIMFTAMATLVCSSNAMADAGTPGTPANTFYAVDCIAVSTIN